MSLITVEMFTQSQKGIGIYTYHIYIDSPYFDTNLRNKILVYLEDSIPARTFQHVIESAISEAAPISLTFTKSKIPGSIMTAINILSIEAVDDREFIIEYY